MKRCIHTYVCKYVFCEIVKYYCCSNCCRVQFYILPMALNCGGLHTDAIVCVCVCLIVWHLYNLWASLTRRQTRIFRSHLCSLCECVCVPNTHNGIGENVSRYVSMLVSYIYVLRTHSYVYIWAKENYVRCCMFVKYKVLVRHHHSNLRKWFMLWHTYILSFICWSVLISRAFIRLFHTFHLWKLAV